MTRQELLKYTQAEIADLLNMYKHYLGLEEQLARIVSGEVPVPTRRISLTAPTGKMQSLDPTSDTRKELQTLADAMKFQNPLIWLGYKRDAYRGTGKEMRTLADLVEHCKVDGICTRRFDAINKQLRRTFGGKDLLSGKLLDIETPLDTLFVSEQFIGLCEDSTFMSEWGVYENSPRGKWRDYVMEKPNHDCEINCTC